MKQNSFKEEEKRLAFIVKIIIVERKEVPASLLSNSKRAPLF